MTMFGRRILILIPHPDDEVVGCAAAIAKARASGSRVFGVFLSHGCIPKRHLWPFQQGGYERGVERRLKEAANAAEFLGITIVGRNTKRAARDIWRRLPEAREEVLTAIGQCAPDCIWVPAFEGGNPDHDGLNALASTLTGVPVFEFSEYNLAGGRVNSNRFIKSSRDDIVHRLKPQEQQIKRDAYALYASEKGNLASLRLEEEQFRPLPKHDYAKRPHKGQLWYERFHWVPFKHPRVDYTKAEEVTAAIAEFLNR
jgi:LmbE family N-acetylglucosaminyl deacetylase